MATFNKVNDWVANAVHAANLSTDQFAVALSNTAPASETSDPTADTNGIIGNVTAVDLSNLSGDALLTTSSSSQTGGTYKLVLADKTLTASGGSIGPFRYVYIYDNTVDAPNPVKPIVGYYDYGSSLTLNDGDSFTIDFSAANGVIQLA